jgi:hypothetical protein
MGYRTIILCTLFGAVATDCDATCAQQAADVSLLQLRGAAQKEAKKTTLTLSGAARSTAPSVVPEEIFVGGGYQRSRKHDGSVCSRSLDRLGVLRAVTLMSCAESCELDPDCNFFTVGVDSLPWCVLCSVAPTNSSAVYAISVTYANALRTAVDQTTDQTTDGAPAIQNGGYLRESSLDGYTCTDDDKTEENSDLVDVDVSGCAVSCFEDPLCDLFSIGESNGSTWCTKCIGTTEALAGSGGSTTYSVGRPEAPEGASTAALTVIKTVKSEVRSDQDSAESGVAATAAPLEDEVTSLRATSALPRQQTERAEPGLSGWGRHRHRLWNSALRRAIWIPAAGSLRSS